MLAWIRISNREKEQRGKHVPFVLSMKSPLCFTQDNNNRSHHLSEDYRPFSKHSIFIVVVDIVTCKKNFMFIFGDSGLKDSA